MVEVFQGVIVYLSLFFLSRCLQNYFVLFIFNHHTWVILNLLIIRRCIYLLSLYLLFLKLFSEWNTSELKCYGQVIFDYLIKPLLVILKQYCNKSLSVNEITFALVYVLQYLNCLPRVRGRIPFLVNAACVRFTARLARTRQSSYSCPIRWAGSEEIDSLSNQCGSLLLAAASGWSLLHWPGSITPPPLRPAGSPREQSACPSACRPPRRLAGVWGVDKKLCQVKSRWTAAGAAAARCSLHPHRAETSSAGKLVSEVFTLVIFS